MERFMVIGVNFRVNDAFRRKFPTVASIIDSEEAGENLSGIRGFSVVDRDQIYEDEDSQQSDEDEDWQQSDTDGDSQQSDADGDSQQSDADGDSQQSDVDGRALYIVLTVKSKKEDPRDYHIQTLASVVGSATGAVEALVRSFKNLSGFSAKLLPEQVGQLESHPCVNRVIPDMKCYLTDGHGH